MTDLAFEHDCTAYSTFENTLSDELVSVISICTPHDTHINIADAAIKNQKKVLCEKPLALSSDSLQNYISNIDIDCSTHLVFQNRFNPAIKQFYEFEKSNLGDPQYIAMTLRWWRDADYYKDWHGNQDVSGGALITQAIHSLELVTHLTRGSAIKNVSATQLKTRGDIPLPDIIVALIEFENSITANIEVCLATRYQNLESSIFVVGNKGSVKISGVALSEFTYPEIEKSQELNKESHYYGNGHTALYKTLSNFYLQKLDPDIELLTRPKQIIKTLELIEAIESAINHSTNSLG